MIRLRLHDHNFTGSASSSLYHASKHIEWLREGDDTSVSFYTDLCFNEAVQPRRGITRIAWILEPMAINPAPYQAVLKQPDRFDLVLTHHIEMLKYGEKFIYYPNGMSWISTDDWKQHPKRDGVSIVASNKTMTEGHQMRHRLIKAAGDRLQVFGRGYNPIEHKIEALGPYRFSVTIENSSAPWYFTEKLIDCFSTFTVPIYWGCPGIARFFDTSGMIVVSSEHEMLDAIDRVSRDGERLYEGMQAAIEKNHREARKYRVAEDWIFEHVLMPRGLV